MITPAKDAWAGTYYDGCSPQRRDVTIYLNRDYLTMHLSDGQVLLWGYGKIRQTQGQFASEPIRLELDDEPPQAAVVEDRRFLEALSPLVSQGFSPGLRGYGPGGWQQAVLAALVAVTLAFLLYRWVAPFAAEVLADGIPVSWEERIGRSVVSSMVPQESRCYSIETSEAIETIVEKLQRTQPESPYRYTVTVAEGDVNAFAAPGGHVVVYSGLLGMTERPEQLAGILAHEMQHVEHRHVTRMLFREAALSALLAAISGGVRGNTAAMDGLMTVGSLAHQRDDEEEADREGMAMLAASGMDPRGMVEMFRAFAEMEEGIPGVVYYLSTHPSGERRVEHLESMIQKTSVEAGPALPEINWGLAKRPCRVSVWGPANGSE